MPRLRVFTDREQEALQDLREAVHRASYGLDPDWRPFSPEEGVVEISIPRDGASMVNLDMAADRLRRQGYRCDLILLEDGDPL